MRRSGHPITTALFATLILLFTGGPVLLALYGSVVPDRVLLNPNLSIFEHGLSFETYRYVFTGELPASYLVEGANRSMISDAARQVPRSIWNSTRIALAAMALNILLGAPAAYVFARHVFPGKRLSFMFIILSPLVPAAALVTPIYMIMQSLGLIGSIWGIILIHTAQALPFTVLITSSVFVSVPRELEEAAQTLGSTAIGGFIKVVLPLALPGLAAAAIFTFVLSWNEVFAAVILTLRERTLPALVLTVLTQSPLPYRFAAAFFMLAPSLIVIFIIRRYLLGLWGRVIK